MPNLEPIYLLPQYDVTYIWNLKYDPNELIYKTEKDT